MRKPGANLEKKNKLLILEQFGDAFHLLPRKAGPAWKPGPACPLQVFADEETAERTARFLATRLGGLWSVARCGNCRMLHVRSTR